MKESWKNCDSAYLSLKILLWSSIKINYAIAVTIKRKIIYFHLSDLWFFKSNLHQNFLTLNEFFEIKTLNHGENKDRNKIFFTFFSLLLPTYDFLLFFCFSVAISA